MEEKNLVSSLNFQENLFLKHIKFALIIAGLVFLIIAIMGPKWGKRNVDFMQKGIEVVIAIDVSKSMLTEDIKPSRLEIATYEINQLIEKLKGNRVALIRFASESEVLCPLTNDINALRSYLDLANGQSLIGGTNIASAINLARKLYTPTKATNRALVIFTDGENHQENPISQAKEAKEESIFIFTYGIGTEKGDAIIERNSSGKQLNYKTDDNGQIVYSKLDEATLKNIAKTGEGAYLRWSSNQNSTKKLFALLDEIEKSEFTAQQIERLEDQFIWFALVSFLIFIFVLTVARNW